MVPTIFSTPPEFNIACEKGPFVKRKVVKSSNHHSSVGYTPPKTNKCPLKMDYQNKKHIDSDSNHSFAGDMLVFRGVLNSGGAVNFRSSEIIRAISRFMTWPLRGTCRFFLGIPNVVIRGFKVLQRILPGLLWKTILQKRNMYLTIQVDFQIVLSSKFHTTPRKFKIAPEKWWWEDYFSYWAGNFSGAMLNFGRIVILN